MSEHEKKDYSAGLIHQPIPDMDGTEPRLTIRERVLRAGVNWCAFSHHHDNSEAALAAANEALTILDEQLTAMLQPRLNFGTAMDMARLFAVALRVVRAEIGPVQPATKAHEQEPRLKDAACEGADPILRLGSMSGADAHECRQCGMCVRWDLTDHRVFGFKAACFRALNDDHERRHGSGTADSSAKPAGRHRAKRRKISHE